jgi:hypothetical protein
MLFGTIFLLDIIVEDLTVGDVIVGDAIVEDATLGDLTIDITVGDFTVDITVGNLTGEETRDTTIGIIDFSLIIGARLHAGESILILKLSLLKQKFLKLIFT